MNRGIYEELEGKSSCADNNKDAVVIGGGFYGVAIAIYLAKCRGLKRVVLLEKESSLLKRASYNNQARIHNGYHYPRSFTTANRSRINMPKFVHDWSDAVKRDFIKAYAIARRNSKVTARQFERFCNEIGAKIEVADKSLKEMFESRLIEDVFLVEEYAFDSTILAEWANVELAKAGVDVRCATRVDRILMGSDLLKVCLKSVGNDKDEVISGRYVFNCTYSGLNQILETYDASGAFLKHEVTEMALMQMPYKLKNLAITVMDGPFFSIMPFPARNLHTLSHVRYTPHFSWMDRYGIDPYKKLADYEKSTRVDFMVRDVERYMPSIRDAKYINSLFEVKTTLAKNEFDDARPILFMKSSAAPGCYSILGGKIDNIYDVFERLDKERF